MPTMHWSPLRNVVLDVQTQIFVDQNSANTRFEHHWRGIEWLLCRSPQKGLPRDPSTPTEFLIYVFGGSELAKTKEVWVLYSYDAHQTVVHAARFGDE